jgi:hypothetical protein
MSIILLDIRAKLLYFVSEAGALTSLSQPTTYEFGTSL